ncbi:MAG TPA: DUF488 domain-containing protein [Puia sp.]|jgi:uncharacterized protein YeaO (DUF488 family)|nr:DUF488 domain-containing protein [Puia sp.]
MAVRIKRVYEPAAGTDGYRILIDRLWPRGLSREKANVDKWLKEVAPSTELRKWFQHDPAKWRQFCTRYRAELKDSTAFGELLDEIRRHKAVTLLFGAKDEEHNDAVALRDLIAERSA